MDRTRATFGKVTEGLEPMEAAARYDAAIEELIIDALGSPGGSPRILDVGAGAGAGEFALRMRDRGFDVTCIEPDDEHWHRLESLGFTTHPSLDSATGPFDGAYLINVLEHIRDDVVALEHIRDLLAPGARIFVWVPAFEALYSDFDFSLGHYRRYTRDSLRRALMLAGFDVSATEYRDSLGWFAALTWRVLPTGDRTTVSADAIGAYDRWIFPASSLLDRIAFKVLGKNVIATGMKI